MVELDQVKQYILANKEQYSRDKIDARLGKSNVSKEMIKKAWDEIENPIDVQSKKVDFSLDEQKIKMPISDIISWFVIVIVVIWGINHFFLK